MANDWPLWSAVMGLALLGDFTSKTQIGRILSTPVLLMIFGFCAAFVGILPVESLSYGAIWSYGVPLSTVLYLLNVDLSSSARWVVPVFSLGAIGTMIGTVIAWVLCGQCLGSEGWKIASAFCATYIGGSLNFAAISSMLEMQKGDKISNIFIHNVLGSLIVAAMAVDNIVMMMYLMIISFINTKETEMKIESEMNSKKSSGRKTGLKDGNLVLGMFLALSCCALGKTLASALKCPNLSIAFMALLASCCSCLMKQSTLSYSTQSKQEIKLEFLVVLGCKEIANCLISVFFVVIGASSGSIRSVLISTPWMFLFASIQLTVHLLFMLSSSLIFKIPLRQILTASNANVGGPATAAG